MVPQHNGVEKFLSPSDIRAQCFHMFLVMVVYISLFYCQLFKNIAPSFMYSIYLTMVMNSFISALFQHFLYCHSHGFQGSRFNDTEFTGLFHNCYSKIKIEE